MNNSIYENLNREDTIAEICLLLPSDKERIILLVEGDSDIKMFRPLFRNNVSIIESYSGKEGVEKIVNESFPSETRVIGIRDKDYEDGEMKKKCFFCDYCCAEMMIVSIDDSFDRAFMYFYPDNDISSSKFRLKCLEYLEGISKIRMLNEKKKWGLRLKGVNINSVFNFRIERMYSNIIDVINQHNNQLMDAGKIEECNKLEKCVSVEDYLTITNGHDFTKIFTLLCNEKGKDYTKKEVEIVFKMAFTKEAFKQTNLYENIMKYQRINQLRIIE